MYMLYGVHAYIHTHTVTHIYIYINVYIPGILSFSLFSKSCCVWCLYFCIISRGINDLNYISCRSIYTQHFQLYAYPSIIIIIAWPLHRYAHNVPRAPSHSHETHTIPNNKIHFTDIKPRPFQLATNTFSVYRTIGIRILYRGCALDTPLVHP